MAILRRGDHVIAIKPCSSKTHPIANRRLNRGTSCHLHAEMAAISAGKAKDGDELIVMRFSKDGKLTMAKPCVFCQQLISNTKFKKIVYSDWDGNFQIMR